MNEFEFEVKQDGLTVARGSGSHDGAISEATHYALVYGQDGPVDWKVYEVTRNAKGKRRRKQVLTGHLAILSIRA